MVESSNLVATEATNFSSSPKRNLVSFQSRIIYYIEFGTVCDTACLVSLSALRSFEIVRVGVRSVGVTSLGVRQSALVQPDLTAYKMI